MSFHERVEEARAASDPGRLVQHVPYAVFLGLGIEVADGELLGRLRFSDGLVGDSSIPALHGGTIGALLEWTAVFSVMWNVESEILPKTINLTVNYLRSGRARDTLAAAIIEKRGRRVVHVRSLAWQDDRERPIASSSAHFLIRGPARSPKAR